MTDWTCRVHLSRADCRHRVGNPGQCVDDEMVHGRASAGADPERQALIDIMLMTVDHLDDDRRLRLIHKAAQRGVERGLGAQGGPSLDAARMKRAIINVICGWQDEDHCGRDADAIAAEYARLSVGEPRPETKE